MKIPNNLAYSYNSNVTADLQRNLNFVGTEINNNNNNNNLLQYDMKNVFNSNNDFTNKDQSINPSSFSNQNLRYLDKPVHKNLISVGPQNNNYNFNYSSNNNNNNRDMNNLNNNPNFNSIHIINNENTLNVSIDEILNKIRLKLSQRGITGILSIGKSFRINDIDNSKTINFQEFSNLCSKYGLGLNSTEIRSAFALFDKRRNGNIDYEEFLKAIRGNLNNFRRNLVEQAFDILDKNRNGVLNYSEISSIYDATRHPSVMRGERTAEDVYSEFLSSFKMNHNNFAANNGNFQISKDEWFEYYENVSMSIDDDAYFETMINNSWKMNTHSTSNNNVKGWANKGNEVDLANQLHENYNKRFNNNVYGKNRSGYNIVNNKPSNVANNINNNNPNHQINNQENSLNRLNNMNMVNDNMNIPNRIQHPIYYNNPMQIDNNFNNNINNQA